MAQFFESLSERHTAFIEAQKLFFVATATADSRINLSPKGMDALRVTGPRRVVWLNLTGSGNETAAHLQHAPRMTLMFCAFEGSPMIMRLFGRARAVHRGEAGWAEALALFGERPGARQLVDVEIESVQTSCGFGVPLFDYQGDRSLLVDWAEKKGESGVRAYWAEKNQTSIDGIATGIVEKSG